MENVPRALKGTIQQKPGCHWCVPAVLVMNKEQKMGTCPVGHCDATASNRSFTLGFTATPPKCSIAHPVALGLTIQDGQWCQQGHSLGNTSSRTPKSLAVSIPEDIVALTHQGRPRCLQSSLRISSGAGAALGTLAGTTGRFILDKITIFSFFFFFAHLHYLFPEGD